MVNRPQPTTSTEAATYIAFDRAWTCTSVSARAARRFGLRPADMQGRCFADLFPESLQSAPIFEQVMHTRQPMTWTTASSEGTGTVLLRVYPTEDGIEAFLEPLTDVGRARLHAEKLQEFTQLMNRAHEVDDVIGAALGFLSPDAQGVMLALHDAETDTLNMHSRVSYDEQLIAPYVSVPLDADLPLTHAFHTGDLLVLSRAACQARYPQVQLADTTQELVFAPLRASGVTLGVMTFSLQHAGRTDTLELSRVTVLAAQLAAALERSLLLAQARHNEHRYRILLDSTNALVVEFDADFQVHRPSHTWETLTGQTFDEYRAHGYLSALHPEDLPAVQALIGAALRPTAALTQDLRVRSASGTYRDVAALAVPIPDDHGAVQSWLVSLRDTTLARRRIRWDAHLHDLLQRASTLPTAQALYDLVLDEVRGALGARHALLIGPVGQDTHLSVLASHGVPLEMAPSHREFFRQFPLPPSPVPSQSPHWRPQAGLRSSMLPIDGSVLAVPLIREGRFVASVELVFPAQEAPAEEPLAFLTDLQPWLAQLLERAHLLHALERSEHQSQVILSSLQEGTLMLDEYGTVLTCNAAIRAMTDMGDRDLTGVNLYTLFEDVAAEVRDESGTPVSQERFPFVRALTRGETVLNETVQLTFSGRPPMWVKINAMPLTASGERRGVVVSMADVTESHQLKLELRQQAHHDALTGLPNRRVFHQLIDALNAGDSAHGSAILLVDIDDFKAVNDTHGHHSGDALLQVVAGRLDAALAGRGVVARLAADEFCIFLSGASPDDVARTAQQIHGQFLAPCTLLHSALQVTVSIGTALTGHQDTTADTVYAHADLALHHAKRDGRGGTVAFDAELGATHDRRQTVERRLRATLRAHRLQVHYQQIINLNDPAYVGFEALARWNDDHLGWVSPGEFIPLAEETGLIHDLGLDVLHAALRQCRAWTAEWQRPVNVSVNVSATQFMRPDFQGALICAVQDSGVNPAQVTLEVTEAVVIHDLSEVVRQLQEVRALGVRVALDDFGTGFSSLAVLEKLAIDTLKVDRALVAGIHLEPRRLALLSAVVWMGRQLNLTVVAEGVEEPEELEILRGLECQCVQGYLNGRPLPPELVPAPTHSPGPRHVSARPDPPL